MLVVHKSFTVMRCTGHRRLDSVVRYILTSVPLVFLDILLFEQRIYYLSSVVNVVFCQLLGLELVLGWAKSRHAMYSSFGLILKFKNRFGTSSTSSNPICFGQVVQ